MPWQGDCHGAMPVGHSAPEMAGAVPQLAASADTLSEDRSIRGHAASPSSRFRSRATRQAPVRRRPFRKPQVAGDRRTPALPSGVKAMRRVFSHLWGTLLRPARLDGTWQDAGSATPRPVPAQPERTARPPSVALQQPEPVMLRSWAAASCRPGAASFPLCSASLGQPILPDAGPGAGRQDDGSSANRRRQPETGAACRLRKLRLGNAGPARARTAAAPVEARGWIRGERPGVRCRSNAVATPWAELSLCVSWMQITGSEPKARLPARI